MTASSNLFLVGPMGSGKTAVGKTLARRLRMPFVDTDAEIERRTGVDIPRIFDTEGEVGFRQREREIVAELTAAFCIEWGLVQHDLHGRSGRCIACNLGPFDQREDLAFGGFGVIAEELAGRGQTILGGDIEIGIAQREATDPEKQAFAAEGRVSETVRLRAMAIGSDSVLAELGYSAKDLARLRAADAI